MVTVMCDKEQFRLSWNKSFLIKAFHEQRESESKRERERQRESNTTSHAVCYHTHPPTAFCGLFQTNSFHICGLFANTGKSDSYFSTFLLCWWVVHHHLLFTATRLSLFCVSSPHSYLQKRLLKVTSFLQQSFIHLFIISNYFIQVRVTMDLDAIPVTLGTMLFIWVQPTTTHTEREL